MSATGLEAFDTTLQKTSIWLNEVMQEMDWPDRHRAYVALRAVLHAVRDRLMPDEAVNLGAQFPMLIRGFYYEGWHPAGKPLKYRHKEEFMQHVHDEAQALDGEELEKSIAAVFHLLSKQIASGEIDKVRNQLPEELRRLWH